MNGRLKLALLLAALSLVLTACPSGGDTTPQPEPVAPPTGLTARAGDGSVTLTWEASAAEDVVQYNILQAEAGADLVVVDEVDGATLHYRAAGLTNGTEYSFAIEAENAAGRISSRTDAVQATPVEPDPGDGTQPMITSFTPPDGAVGIGTNSNIAVSFSESMDESSSEAAFAVIPSVTCAFSWGDRGTRLTCDPQGGLDPNVEYTVTISEDARDRLDNSLAAAREFSFSTGAGEVNACVFGASNFGGCTFGP